MENIKEEGEGGDDGLYLIFNVYTRRQNEVLRCYCSGLSPIRRRQRSLYVPFLAILRAFACAFSLLFFPFLILSTLTPTHLHLHNNVLTFPSDIFQKLTANGAQGGVYQNIRANTNYNSPVTDLASKDLRCNVGGASGASTSTVSVAAGSSVTFTADIAVYHQGPVSL